MSRSARVLLLADTHLGFDLPARPRVDRRRRGHDFQANFERALEPALRGEVDVVVHGGDVFHRPRVAPSLAYEGLAPLVGVAEAGVPVIVVPGNHERSRIPHHRFARHPLIHILDRPRVVTAEAGGVQLRFAGFPFERRVGGRFRALLRASGWRPDPAAVDLLCLHQCVEGATVGPSDFTFRPGPDVVRGADIPAGFAAVLSGHIHRHQILERDLSGTPLPAPVLYPGSVERTSLAEVDETKGYMVVEVGSPGSAAGPRWWFRPLPARPMLVRDLDVGGRSARALDAALRRMVAAAPSDAVLRVRPRGVPAGSEARRVVTAAHLRRIAPATMNVELREPGRPPGRMGRSGPSSPRPLQPGLGL
jgi:exonuclease SbcD